ncbi:MAG: DNA polymerase III subunit gamma/tau [bacterium]
MPERQTGVPRGERRVLTLKYRPGNFAELMVQDHVRDTLTRAIANNRVANAYLFAGPRGVGKTSTARILAKCLNCLSSEAPTTEPCGRCPACVDIAGSRSLDVIEIDGASNRGIEQVRELRENIKYSPASLRCKVYIIDEVHMLTEQAFNALLKTLEEPPAHARFVFATTEGHLVPATIISRCQRFDFRRATPEEIARRLRWLAVQENIKASDAALLAIARRADGAIRDGESILEQLATYQPEGIELAGVTEMLGLVPADAFPNYTDRLLDGDIAGSLAIAEGLFDRGFDVLEFYSGLVGHFRNIAYTRTGSNTDALGLLPEERARLTAQTGRITHGQVVRALELLVRVEDSARHTLMPRILLDYISLELAAILAPTGDSAAPLKGTVDRRQDAGIDTRREASGGTAAAAIKPTTEKVSRTRTPGAKTDGTRRPTTPSRAPLKEEDSAPPNPQPVSPPDSDNLVERMRRFLGEVEEDRRQQ